MCSDLFQNIYYMLVNNMVEFIYNCVHANFKTLHRDTNASGVIFGLTYIFQQCLHNLPEFVPVARVHPGTPHASQNLRAVLGVVPHHMEGQLLGISQPLGHGSRLSAGQSAVQVPADH